MNQTWKSYFRLGTAVFSLYLAARYWPAISRLAGRLLQASLSLVIGCIIAYLVNILTTIYEKHLFAGASQPAAAKLRGALCILGAFLTLAALIALIILLVIPQLVDCIQLLAKDLQLFISTVSARLKNLHPLSDELFAALSGINWEETISKGLQMLTSGLGSVVSIASSLFSGVITGFMSFVFSIYLLAGKKSIASEFRALLTCYTPPAFRQQLSHVLTVASRCFRGYIIGQCTEAVILGVLCILGMLIFRFPYAVMIGTLIGFTALIPIAGAYIGAALGAFMIFMVSPLQAALFLLFIVILQQLEGNLIYPKVVGSSIGLPAIWVFTAVTIGGGILGIPGMLLAVPTAAVLYQLLWEDIHRRK